MPRIVIGGDYSPVGVNEPLSRSRDGAGLFGDILPFLRSADLSIVNLEGPLIDAPSPVSKSGPVLGADAACINALVAAGVGVVGLANNHTMDHGARGFATTVDALERRGLAHVGAGRDLDEAGRMLVTRAGGLRVGVLAMAEREFGVAGRREPGVNPIDLARALRAIEQRTGEVDFLVVLLHAGNELYPWPRPSLMETCRFLVDRGADAVICQHSHCVGCYERYRDATIVYGQGNLVFDAPGEPPEFYEGVLLCFEARPGAPATLDLVPYEQSRPRAGVRRLRGRDEERLLRALDERSRAISDAEVVEARWLEFCRRMERHYLRRFGAPHRLLRGLDRLTGLAQRLYAGRRARDEALNLIRCESHREALITIFSDEAADRGPAGGRGAVQ